VMLMELQMVRMDICTVCTVIDRELLARFVGLSVAGYICLCSGVNPWQGFSREDFSIAAKFNSDVVFYL